MNFARHLNQEDAVALSRLAEHLYRLGDTEIALADMLADIVATAVLAPAATRGKKHVGLNAEVKYIRHEDQTETAVTIVLPPDAQPASGRISVLAPLALALIGRRVDELVKVDLPMGKTMSLKICDVRHPALEDHT
ncbi:MAG TPA: GreA/GreB family elongation factor [Oxalicibacterium sp.]|jgi:regulator of nucleoside diphosphate kinase|nr:GreA/GreB family elongation factor [Oxalicibacterium sp.]